MHGNLMHMLARLLSTKLYHLRQQKQHLNNRLLLLSTFTPQPEPALAAVKKATTVSSVLEEML